MLKNKRISVSELIDNGKIYIGDGYRAKNSELNSVGFPFARAGNLNNGFLFEDADCIPFDEVKKVGIKKSEIGDVAFTSKGTIGRFGFVKETTKEFVYSPQICFWRSLDYLIIDPYYLYYWMNSYLFLNQVAMVSGQTDMALYVNLRDQRKMFIDLPDILVQKKIASILSSYDDLIENNNQRIKLLEDMAEEIYKEWFVRFRFPGYENSKFLDKEGNEVEHGTEGAIPEGWEKKRIKEIVEIVSGYAFKSDTFNDVGEYKLVTIKNVQNGYFVTETTDCIDDLPKNLKDDILLKDKDILLSLTGNIGRICLVYGDNYLLNQRVAKLKPQSDFLYEYVYLFFRSDFLRMTLENISNGAAQQNLSPIEMSELEFTTPTELILKEFSDITESFFEEMIILLKKNQILQETRDLLLPRLISGKLSVEELELEEII